MEASTGEECNSTNESNNDRSLNDCAEDGSKGIGTRDVCKLIEGTTVESNGDDCGPEENSSITLLDTDVSIEDCIVSVEDSS